MITKDLHRMHRSGILVGCLVTAQLGCTNEAEDLRFVLRATVAPGEPPANLDIGILVDVQAAIILTSSIDASQRGTVMMTAVGGTLSVPSSGSGGTRICFAAPVQADSLSDAPVQPVLVYPEGRSSRVFAQLWNAATPGSAMDNGCPIDLTGRVVLDSASLLVPPDESEPDPASSTGDDTEMETQPTTTGSDPSGLTTTVGTETSGSGGTTATSSTSDATYGSSSSGDSMTTSTGGGT